MMIMPVTHPIRRRAGFLDLTFYFFILAAVALISGATAAPAGEPASGPANGSNAPASIRIGVAQATWQGLNRNDATAAITTWAKTIMQERGAAVAVVTTLFESDAELARALADGRVDCVSMPADQFLALDRRSQPAEVYLAAHDHSIGERYVLLVHQDRAPPDLAGLRGGRLLAQSTARTSLALPWLDCVLAAQQLEPPERLLASIRKTEKPSKAMLPVFFRQAEACLVTSNAFDTASELNPQLRKELRVLAMSPEVVPAVFFFRCGYKSFAREQLEPSIVALHQSPAGLQVLTVFQCDQMMKCPASCLEATRQLLARRDRLRGATPSAGKAVTSQEMGHEKP
jgi:phosphonate transport system substrate-binding protein